MLNKSILAILPDGELAVSLLFEDCNEIHHILCITAYLKLMLMYNVQHFTKITYYTYNYINFSQDRS